MLELFPIISCLPLPTPSIDPETLQRLDLAADYALSPAYHRGLDDITNFIEKSQPKTIGNTVVGGAVLSQVLATLVQAANEGLVPAIPSLWGAFQEQARTAAQGDCTRAYDELAEKELLEIGDRALTVKEIDALHHRGVRACLPLLAMSDMNATSTLEKRRDRLMGQVSGAQMRACTRAREQARRSVSSRGSTLRLPIAGDALDAWATEEVEREVASAVRDTVGLGCMDLAELLREDLSGVVAALSLDNAKLMTKALLELDTEVRESLRVPTGLAVSEVPHAREQALAEWAREYDARASFARDEAFGALYRAQARDHAEEKVKELVAISQAHGKKFVVETGNRAEAALRVAIRELPVLVPREELLRRADAEVAKATETLEQELRRFAGEQSVREAMGALKTAGRNAKQARMKDQSDVAAARIDAAEEVAFARVKSLPNCEGPAWSEVLADSYGFTEDWAKELRDSLRTRVSQRLADRAELTFDACRGELRKSLMEEHLPSLEAFADESLTHWSVQTRAMELLGVQQSPQAARAAAVEAAAVVSHLARTRPVLVASQCLPYMGAVALAIFLWKWVRSPSKGRSSQQPAVAPIMDFGVERSPGGFQNGYE